MNPSDPDDQIREFYQTARLPEERVDAVIDAARFAQDSRRWRRVAIASSVGCAAMVMIVVGLLISRPSAPNNFIAQNPPSAEQVASTAGLPPDPQPQATVPAVDSPPSRYQLVAVRSHGDRCPHCRETSLVFDQLVKSLHDEPIEFHLVDLSQPVPSSEREEHLASLHLAESVEGRSETAFLAFVEQDRGLIAEFKPSMKVDRIASRIRETLSTDE